VHLFAIVLLGCALALLLGAEWPRLSTRVGTDARASRARKRQKRKLSVVQGEGEADDFAASVERDLANLPVFEERDGHSRR
jgi:hypothetical protein